MDTVPQMILLTNSRFGIVEFRQPSVDVTKKVAGGHFAKVEIVICTFSGKAMGCITRWPITYRTMLTAIEYLQRINGGYPGYKPHRITVAWANHESQDSTQESQLR